MKYKKYPVYKVSGVEWVGNIPEEWNMIRIKNIIVKINNGIWGNEENGDKNDIYCIRVNNFDRKKASINIENLTIRNIENNNLNNLLLEKGNLLIEKSGGGEIQPVGFVVIFNQNLKTVYSNFIARIKLKKNISSIFINYYFYFMYYKGINKKSIKQTTGIQNIDINNYFNEKISIPPLTEQKKIASFLDKKTTQIDDLINKKKQMIDLLKEERTSLINKAVTKGINQNVKIKNSGIEWLGEIPEHWEVKKIKYVTSKIGSGITPSGGANVYLDEGIILLRSQNIHFDGLKLDDVAFISDEMHNSMENSKAYKGDVLLNITGASIGRCFFLEDNIGEVNVNQHVCILRPKDLIKTKYLYYNLSSNIGQIQINLCQTGGNREGLNFEQLKNFIIFLPSNSEQKIIVAHIEKETKRIDTIINKCEKEIELLQEYRTALISEAVTGKIDVREEVI